MTKDITELALVSIESTLICNLRPSFLTVLYENSNPSYIHIIISHRAYKDMKMVDRISSIFRLLSEKNPDIINTTPIIVETFSSTEMEDFFEYL